VVAVWSRSPKKAVSWLWPQIFISVSPWILLGEAHVRLTMHFLNADFSGVSMTRQVRRLRPFDTKTNSSYIWHWDSYISASAAPPTSPTNRISIRGRLTLPICLRPQIAYSKGALRGARSHTSWDDLFHEPEP